MTPGSSTTSGCARSRTRCSSPISRPRSSRAARALNEDPRQVPFIKSAVFLHDPGLVSELDEFQRAAVYGRNDGGSGLPGIWDGLLAMLRRDGRVLLALEDQPGADEPTSAELADYAAALGAVAADVAVRDPLPGRVTVLRELRAVGAPEGMIPPADTRLVALAAAMARGVGVSPRLELYPLDLAQALRVSQAVAGVRPDTGIGTDDLLARVRARFPALAVLADTTYVELEEALDQAGFPLAYDQQRKRFLPRAREAVARHTEQTVSALASTWTLIEDAQSELTLGRDPRRVKAARLQAARRRGGFVALTVKGPELPGVAERLAERFDVTPLALDALLLTTLREPAQEQQAPGQVLLTADAAFAAREASARASPPTHGWRWSGSRPASRSWRRPPAHARCFSFTGPVWSPATGRWGDGS